MEREEFDRDGILVGWSCKTYLMGSTKKTTVFIPRRADDIERDRQEQLARARWRRQSKSPR